MATAYVLINCELGSEESIIRQLKSLDGVVEVHGTFGAVSYTHLTLPTILLV